MLRSSKAANELKQVSQRPRGETEASGSQSSTSGANNPSTTTTFLPSAAAIGTPTTGNKVYATLCKKGSKKIPPHESNQTRKPEPPTRDFSSSPSVATITATPLTHVVMAQGQFPQGHVHLTSADLLVHPQPTSHHDSGVLATAVSGSGGTGCSGLVVGGGAPSGPCASLFRPSSGIQHGSVSTAAAAGIVEASEEWVLHTSCQGESNELLRECCLQSESRSDDSYPVQHSPSRKNVPADSSFHHQQGHILQGGGGGRSLGESSGNPNCSSMIYNIMTDPPSLSSPINPSHIAQAICPPPPSDSDIGSLSHHPWSTESHHSLTQVCILKRLNCCTSTLVKVG